MATAAGGTCRSGFRIEMAEATGTNGTGTSTNDFPIILNAFIQGTGKCRRYPTASYGYMETRLYFDNL